jgi:hypothetical protein
MFAPWIRHPPDCASGTLGGLLYADKATTPVSEKDWGELVQSIAAGDQRALHVLYDQTHRILFTLIVRISNFSNNRETAEELTLDVFHDVWRRASTYALTVLTPEERRAIEPRTFPS